MRVVDIDKVKPGMIVGRNIYNSNNGMLLSQGVILTERYIKRLKDSGITAVYVSSEFCNDLEFEDIISDQTRREAVATSKEMMNSIKSVSNFNAKKINDIIDRIINEIIGNKGLLACLIDLRSLNDYLYAHSVNVAVLSVLTGVQLGFTQQKLRQLAMGAIFHDVGKIAVDDLYKDTGDDQSKLIDKHPWLGFEILRKANGMSLHSAHVALQHHEHYDGTGSPRGLAGEKISELARIVGVASFYDNLTTDRPDKPRLTPHYALEALTLNSGAFFDPEIVKVFVSNIALFPVGTVVLLNSGEKGIIIKVRKEFPTRPVVRIFEDETGRKLNPPFDCDLMDNHTYFLEKILEEEEI